MSALETLEWTRGRRLLELDIPKARGADIRKAEAVSAQSDAAADHRIIRPTAARPSNRPARKS